MLTTLGLKTSFGFGDRLGLATPGHIEAVQGSPFAPVFAQQSIRENQRTGRSLEQVLADARRAVEAAGWDAPWGADGDHLKQVDDLAPFVAAGYTFFTVDPGMYVDNAADHADIASLREKRAERQNWDELSDLYLERDWIAGLPQFTEETLLRAVVKYGKAVEHTIAMHRRLKELKDSFDFEVSIDETDAPTTPLEHFFIAKELQRHDVHFTSLAPRFIGRFEKGVDFIGDVAALDAEMARHALVSAHFNSYKISLHSGSDKFSVYPLLVKHWGARIHVKTAGTSYLEALRTISAADPALFDQIWQVALERYPQDRATYHVSARPELVKKSTLPADLLDDFHAREMLHVTFGSALSRYGREINSTLARHQDLYRANLKRHFKKHLDLLQ